MKAFNRTIFFAVVLTAARLAFAHTHPTQMTPAADSAVSAPDSVIISLQRTS
jgi:hypothetical protein